MPGIQITHQQKRAYWIGGDLLKINGTVVSNGEDVWIPAYAGMTPEITSTAANPAQPF
jgi:hypothetical protein